MGFYELPPELVFEICSYLGQQDTASLVLTCQRYAGLLTQELYKHAISKIPSGPSAVDTNGLIRMERRVLLCSKFWNSRYVLDILRRYELSYFVSSDEDDISMLHRFTARNATGVVRMLLERGANPDMPTSAGNTPLLYAVSQRPVDWDGFGPMVQLFAEHNANITAKTLFTESLLSLTLKFAPEPIVISVINCLPRDLSSEEFHAPFYLLNATRSRMEEATELLLEKRVITIGAGDDEKIPLLAAAAVGSERICNLFVTKMSENGICISTANFEGHNALHIALMQGSEPVARLLLEAGINPFVKSCDGELPIDFVSAHRMENFFKVLKRCVLSYPLKRDEDFKCRLFGCDDETVETVRFLLLLAQYEEPRENHKADSPLHYYAALHWTIHDKSHRIFNALLKLGHDVHKQGRFGNTCLHTLLASRGLRDHSKTYLRKFKAMMARYEDMTTSNDCGNTVLHYACSVRDLDIMSPMLQKMDQQTIMAANEDGNTALHTLVSRDDGREKLPYTPHKLFGGTGSERKMVQLLLKHGADKSARNEDERTPAQLVPEGTLSCIPVMLR